MEYGGAASVQKNNNNSSATATAFGSLAESSSAAELGDFIDELLIEGCWLETTAGSGFYNMMHPSSSSVSCGESNTNTTAFAQLQPQPQYYLPTNNSSSSCSEDQIMMLQQDPSSSEEESFVVGKRWWIGPKGGPGGPPSSVKERLVVAVGYLKEYYTSSKIISNNTTNNVLFQVWVPPCRSSPTGSGLHFHNHISSINDFHFHEAVGFPTLTPKANPPDNVRFFRSHDYPRLLQYDARGSFALPVFERGTGACLGVLDILIANHQSHMFNYRPQLLDNNVCNALEAVDFRSCQNLIIQPPAINKVFEELYQAALNEIVEVMTSVCKTHNLPLALTWAPCIQQGKCCGGCVSTLDSACFVGDLDILGFQEACSECHLLRDQGIVGTSLTTTKPCFAMDITAFSKAEYPLAHHAIVFGLHAAVAIPLRSVYTGSAADFVLEFFLPKECQDSEEQKHLLNSLSMVVQQACRSLHVATTTTDLLLDNDDFTLPSLTTTAAADHDHKLQQLFAAQMQAEEEAAAACAKEQSSSTTSWIAHMMEAQEQQNKKGKGVCVSMEYHQLEEPKEEFKVTTNWDTTTNQGHLHFSSDFGHIDHTSASASLGSGSRASADGGLDQQDSYVAASFGGRRSSSASSGGRKSSDKRRTKAEKTISLPVLRQYFAGSLKDAAKSIGVCPTTLKRICRQHGITRWPSRKIKKVGHSLKKLQLVIDSVQGAEGAIQIGSFYASFPELSSADFSSSSSPATTARSNQPSKKAAPNTLKSIAAAASASCSSQTNATFGAGNHHHQANNNSTALMMMTESCDAAAELQQHASSSMLIQEEEEETKHFTWNSLRDRDRGGGVFRVKATFVDEKIRFSLQQNWGFRELQEEIARRFNLNDISNMDLKYLDEDGEWVLLACDADLHECKDIHTSSQARTIRLSLFHPNTSFATTSTNNTPERT